MVLVFVALWHYITFSRGNRSKFIWSCFCYLCIFGQWFREYSCNLAQVYLFVNDQLAQVEKSAGNNDNNRVESSILSITFFKHSDWLSIDFIIE